MSGTTTLQSLEVRWFVAGSVPPEVVDWFRSGHKAAPGEHRVDSYLVLDCDDLGVKRRNGGPIETKLRKGIRDLAAGEGVTVRAERWTKWQPSSLDLDWESRARIDVDKAVLTRTFGPGMIEVAGPVDGSLPRCEVELAVLTVNGDRSWTYAFEATGPPSERESLLTCAIERMWPPAPFDLTAEGLEEGYPAWLSRSRSAVASGR